MAYGIWHMAYLVTTTYLIITMVPARLFFFFLFFVSFRGGGGGGIYVSRTRGSHRLMASLLLYLLVDVGCMAGMIIAGIYLVITD
jgi:hypothetical protein